MAKQVDIRELRENLTATISRVRAGETLEITHHRQRVAVLAPIRVDRIDQLADSIDITPGDPLELPLRKHAVTAASTASQALEDDRTEH